MTNEKETKPTKEMNVLQRLMKARVDLSKMKLKKTGYNKHLQYYYFELDDFLPAVVELSDKYGIVTMFSMNDEFATLEVINVDNPDDKWSFRMQTAEAKVQGGQAVQNVGSARTYLRRYLMMTAFEVAEASDIEKATGSKPKNDGLELTDEEIKKIHDAENLEHLNNICKAMIAEKGAKYKNLIIAEYTARKEELGGSNETA